MDPTGRPHGIERLLRSVAGRALLTALLVLVAALFTAENVSEVFERRRIEVSWSLVFAHQLAGWSCWGLAAWPILTLAHFLWRKLPGWPLAVLVQVPLAVGMALGLTTTQYLLEQRILDPVLEPVHRRFPPGPGERRERPPRRGGPPFRGGPRRPEFTIVPPRDRDERKPFGHVFLSRARVQFGVYWLLLGIGGGVVAFLQSREREREAAGLTLRASRLETELARAELGSLRDQLQPHFLFNALHTVGALVQQGRDTEAGRVLTALGDLLRRTLEVGEKQEVRLREELEVTESYLEVERARLGERLDVRVEVEPGCARALVPALLLQPLVENAVQHGIAPRPEGGCIRFSARRAANELELELFDDGPGFPAHVLEDTPSGDSTRHRPCIGLANARERLRLLYGSEQSFRLENLESGGAHVTVRLPFRT